MKIISSFVIKRRLLVFLIAVFLLINLFLVSLQKDEEETVDSMFHINVYKRSSLFQSLQDQEINRRESTPGSLFSFCVKSNKSISYPSDCQTEMEKEELDQNNDVKIGWSKERYELSEKNNCSVLKTFDFIYQPEICDSNDSVIILITSSPSHIEERQTIRRTWGNTRLTVNYLQNRRAESQYARSARNVRIVFLLGTTDRHVTQESIASESLTFGDIVQGNYVDTYHNLTYKTIMGMTWAAKQCQQAEFVVKTDDDTFVNINNLMLFLQNNDHVLKQGIAGRCFGCTKPDRDTGSKSYISYEDYPGTFYPGFCSGVGYVTSMRILQLLVICFQWFPVLPLEDIYISLCILNLDLKLFNVAGFITVKPPTIPCLFKQNQLIVAHGLTPRLLNYIWTTPCDLGLNVKRSIWKNGGMDWLLNIT